MIMLFGANELPFHIAYDQKYDLFPFMQLG